MSDQAKHNPFTVKPNVDVYNGKDLPGFKIHGYCKHLAPSSAAVYVHQADAQAWVDTHVARFH